MIRREEDWTKDVPFGVCPACGADANEVVGCEEGEVTLLFCSDPTCTTLYTGPRAQNPAPTDWLAPNPLARRIAWILRNHLDLEDDDSDA